MSAYQSTTWIDDDDDSGLPPWKRKLTKPKYGDMSTLSSEEAAEKKRAMDEKEAEAGSSETGNDAY